MQLCPAPTAIKTQPLSKCVLLVCAYQRTRQRNMGIAKKKMPRLLTTIWQTKAVWKTLFQNKSGGTINPVYLPRNSWTTQRMCQSTKHCLFQLLPNTLSCNLWGTSHSNSTLSNRGQLAFTYQKDTANEQGRGRKTYKVFSLNPLYQFKANVGKISFNKSWGMNNPAISPKSPELFNEQNMTVLLFGERTCPHF